ncbi:MAG: ATP-binding cassette domain-containing protein [Bacteroidales bacterium]|jgi:ABC-2 type transport system ATP-binding protein|nr:ATP-binding cassette domain-containing protein [Bacteroidales bacterium]
MATISVENITRRYGSLTALNGISFEVERGELFGLIGPDVAGKTSLFRIIAVLRGCNVDQPRNLTKSVTVE